MKSALLLLLVLPFAACSKSGKSADAACMGGSSCGQPCDLGNNLGVGRYCTKGGGECNKNSALGTGGYIFCTIDYDSSAPDAFCTGPCTSDSECGSDAYCDGSGTGGSKGCVPASCGGTANPPADAAAG